MQSLLILLMTLMCFAIIPILSHAQTGSSPAINSSPISQPLTREGDLAVELAGALKLGITENGAEAEDLLTAADVATHNGCYPGYS